MPRPASAAAAHESLGAIVAARRAVWKCARRTTRLGPGCGATLAGRLDELRGRARRRLHGRISRTYFINERGDEALGTAWAYLDMTALGRQEEWEDSPEGSPQTPPYGWWNLHDECGSGA